MRLKVGSSKTRGYSAYHVTWDGYKVFLRSMNEYVVACMLDNQKIPYLTEKATFKFDDRSYKPDFFIYEDTTYMKVIKIIEVKHQGDRESYLAYMKAFCDQFQRVGIEYDVLYKFDALKTKYCCIEKQEAWKNHSKDTTKGVGFVGENNPMFGVKHTESTKRLIGDKAIERWQNTGYRQNQLDKMDTYWSSSRGVAAKKRLSQLRLKEALEHRMVYEALPDIHNNCKQCNEVVTSKEGYEFCPTKCERTWKYKNVAGTGKHTNKIGAGYKRIWTYLDSICKGFDITSDQLINNLDVFVSKAKDRNIIPKNKGLSKKTLLKFNVIEEVSNGQIKINYR